MQTHPRRYINARASWKLEAGSCKLDMSCELRAGEFKLQTNTTILNQVKDKLQTKTQLPLS